MLSEKINVNEKFDENNCCKWIKSSKTKLKKKTKIKSDTSEMSFFTKYVSSY